MRAVIQVTRQAALAVDEKPLWQSGRGLTVLLGISREDDTKTADKMIDKLLKLRILPDEQGRINRSVLQEGAAVCIISNFTLYANCAASRRPDFARAMGYEKAQQLFAYFVDQLRKKAAEWAFPAGGCSVFQGVFGGDMLLSLQNDGPVTVILDSAEF